MRLLLEVFMIVILIILVSICYASIVSAAYDAPEVQTNHQQQQQQQQLPFCDEDQIQQTNRNAGYLFYLMEHIFHSFRNDAMMPIYYFIQSIYPFPDCCMFQHWTVKYPHWIFWMMDKRNGQSIRRPAQ